MATDAKIPQPHRSPPNARSVSVAGLEMIKRCVPFSATRRGTPGALQTIGYGHFLRPADAGLRVVDDALATQLLREDLRCIEIYLNATVRVLLEQHEFDALASLVFDVGMRTYERSFLRNAINAGDREEAGRLLMRWEMPGNTNPARRSAEAMLFLHGSGALVETTTTGQQP